MAGNLRGTLAFALFAAACGGSDSATSPSATSSAIDVVVVPTLLGVGETGRGIAALRSTVVDVTGQTSWNP